MAAQTPPPDLIENYLEQIFLGLRNISHISSMYSKYLQKYLDVTSSQLLFLRAINKENNLSAGEIGRRIFIKPGTITGRFIPISIRSPCSISLSSGWPAASAPRTPCPHSGSPEDRPLFQSNGRIARMSSYWV